VLSNERLVELRGWLREQAQARAAAGVEEAGR
jgi:hypothetical protein